MRNTLLRNNRKSARSRWGNEIDASLLQTLKVHTERFKLSISNGDLLLLDRRWYVTNTGLVGLANRCHCCQSTIGIPSLSQCIQNSRPSRSIFASNRHQRLLRSAMAAMVQRLDACRVFGRLQLSLTTFSALVLKVHRNSVNLTEHDCFPVTVRPNEFYQAVTHARLRLS
jgi:hypothetical protein